MKIVIVIGFLFSVINNAFSHSPNEVSFSIYEKDTFVLVDTEFPWSIRNAVFMADSTLNESSSFDEIKVSLFNYVTQNFVMTSVDGKVIKLLKLIDLKNQGHHENYQFVFENKEIGKIKNTLLFNFSEKQKNFHFLNLEGEKTKFVLTPEFPEKTIAEKSYFSKIVLAMSILFLIIAALYVNRNFNFHPPHKS